MKFDRETKNMIAIIAFIGAVALAFNYIVVPNTDQSFISWSVGLFVVAVMFWIWIRRDDLAEKRTEALKAAEEAAHQAEELAQKAQGQAEAKIEIEEEKVEEVAGEVEEPVAEEVPEETEDPVTEDAPEPVAEPKEEPVAEIPAEEAEASEPDNLTKVEGIGPAYAKLLVAAGVTTFTQLASKTQADIEKLIKDAGKRRPASVNTWAEQAGFAAKGDWDGLQKLQDSLDGGRRK
jgi:small subunit ribosomal protein S2